MDTPKQPVILTIDDEKSVRESFRDFLEDYDYTVLEAENGRIGLEVFREQKPDMILVDLRMPEVDGLDVLAAVSEESPDTPLIVISGTGVISDVVEALRLGAWDYLLKPLEDLDVLRYAVEKELKRARLVTDNKMYQEHLEELVKKRTAALEETYRELTASEQKYRSLIETTSEGYALLDKDDCIVEVNDAFTALCDYTREEAGGMPFLTFFDEQDKLRVKQLTAHPEKAFGSTHELTLRTKPGEKKQVLLSMTALADEEKSAGCFVFFMDITDRHRMRQQIEHQTLHDSLTGLPNRRLCEERIERAMERSRQEKAYRYAVLYLDLDRFKMITESLGYSTGDQVLYEVAQRILSCLTDIDTVARIESDEFALLLEDSFQPRDPLERAEAIRKILLDPIRVNGHDIIVNASIGVLTDDTCTQGDHCSGPQEVLRNAHVAMYQAKSAGGAKICTFAPAMLEEVSNLLTLEHDMDRALQEKEFYPVFQPIFSFEETKLCGFEVLARWNHPQRGVVNPGEFIPIAEETGRIIALGESILRDACRIMVDWCSRSEQAKDLTLSVNLSTRQLTQADPVQSIRTILEETGLHPHNLRLEITETALMHNATRAIRQLEAIKALGVSLSIDDFGTGYCNMSYLYQMPLDILKIDLSFIRTMDSTPKNTEIIKAIMSLAHGLGLRCVAEGVEKQEQYDRLANLDCDYCQGFFLSQPLPPEEAFILMSQRSA